MSGWLLILSLLVLGGVLATLGDRLGSRVGKARLSIFNLRPRRTAVLITVLTGSLISSLSLGFMLLVSRQLRVGLFQLDDLQNKLKNSRLALAPLKEERKLLEARISTGEKELKQLEGNLIALRRGDVVISSGQSLARATIKLESPSQAKNVIERLLQEANLEAFRRVRPRERPNRQILLVPRADIQRLDEIISERGTWVVNIRSAANVLRGERSVYAFPDVRPNRNIVRAGEIIAKTTIKNNEMTTELIRKRIKLLLASTLAEVKRRGSLTSGLQFNASSINKLGSSLRMRNSENIEIEAVSVRDSDTADSVVVALQINQDENKKDLLD